MMKNVKVEKMFTGIVEENFNVEDDGIIDYYNRNKLLSNWMSKHEVTVCLGQPAHVWDDMLYIPARHIAHVTLNYFTRNFTYTSGEGMVSMGFANLDHENKKLAIEMADELIELDLSTGVVKTTSKEQIYKYDLQFLGRGVCGLRRHMQKAYGREYDVVLTTSTGTRHRQEDYCVSWCDNSFDVDFSICVKGDPDNIIRKVKTFANCKTLHSGKAYPRFEVDKVQGVYLRTISPVFKGCWNQVYFE